VRDAQISEAAPKINRPKNRRKVDFKVDFLRLLDLSLMDVLRLLDLSSPTKGPDPSKDIYSHLVEQYMSTFHFFFYFRYY
jgi:hypothetical protein